MKRHPLVLAVLLTLCGVPLAAQDFQQGFNPYQAYDTNQLDSVSMANGNLMVKIPIISYPQRGTLPNLSYSLHYQNMVWLSICSYDDYGVATECTIMPEYEGNTPTLTGTLALGGIVGALDYGLIGSSIGGSESEYGEVYDASEAAHETWELNSTGWPQASMDATGILLNSSGGSLSTSTYTATDKNGIASESQFPCSSTYDISCPLVLTQIQDPTGNRISLSYSTTGSLTGITDSIGRSIPPFPESTTTGTPITQNFPGPPVSSTVPISATYASFTFESNVASVCSICIDYTGTIEMLQSVTLPNDTQWSFGYDSYGDLTSITLPTGGQIAYTWALPSDFATQVGDGYTFARQITTRSLSPDGGSTWHQWTYNFSGTYSTTTTVTDPDGNEVIHTMNSSNWPRETEVQYYNGTSTLLETIDKTYFPIISALTSATNPGVVPKEVTTTWPSGQVSQMCQIYDNNTNTTCTGTDANNPSGLTFYSSYGTFPRVVGSSLYEYEWDYGSGSPGSLIRETATTYQWEGSSSYLNANLLAFPSSVTVYDGSGERAQTTYAYDESGYGSCSPCGQQTTANRYYTSSAYVTSHTAFTGYGMPSLTIDPNGNHTCYTYDSTGAFLSEVQKPNPSSGSSCSTVLVDTYSYDANTGLLNSHTDPNSQTTSYTYDKMRRTTKISYPDTGYDEYSYDDSFSYGSSPNFTYTNAVGFTEVAIVDGLGRKIHTQLTSDPSGTDYTDYTYDDLGRQYSMSNPHRSGSSPTDGTTYYAYDALNRITTVTEQDGSTSTTNYSNYPYTTFTDEAGKQRKTWTDGLGRTTGVWEDPSGLNYYTSYSYDALDNLTSVTQSGSHGRSFSYDSLARLTSVTNPESGTTSYTYDGNGNLQTKTDARSITMYYYYDALNRMTYKSDGVSEYAVYYYDLTETGWGAPTPNSIGRLSEASAGSMYGSGCIGTIFGYDSMGRVAHRGASTPADCGSGGFDTYATYDAAGNLASMTFPDGRVVTYQYNDAMQPIQVQFNNYSGDSVDYDYLSSATYAPTGAPTILTLGSGVTETYTYSNRLQPCNLQIALGSSTWVNRTGSYYSGGSCTGSSGNNGNVTNIADSLQPNRTQTFGYDGLNRINQAYTTGTSSAGCFGETYTTDAFGNLSGIGSLSGYSSCVQDNLSVTIGSNNQITTTGFSYDGAGNLLTDGVNNYTYDSEGRLATFNSSVATYSYDAEGNRVSKQTGGDTIEYDVYNGQTVAEHDFSAGYWSDYIYLGSRLLAQANTYEEAIHTSGTNCSDCGAQYTLFTFPESYAGYVIQSGDQLAFRQYQPDNGRGGMIVTFSDGSSTRGSVYDQDGVLLNDGEIEGPWFLRIGDLSSFAGKTISAISLITETDTPGGSWDEYYNDIVLLSADGTVRPIYNREPTFSLSEWSTSGVSGLGYGSDHWPGAICCVVDSTMYFHGDSLGSSRLQTTYFGYPVWSATYAPFGMELSPEMTVNTHKFTGKERDSESGNDNFGARYYASNYGRFLSPDQSMALDIREVNPQRWNQYAYVINNPLAYNDPTGNDAIAVDFSGMVAHLGHEGIISVLSDGTTGYARFGPGDSSVGNLGGAYGQGQIDQYTNLPKLQFDGIAPTPESLNALLQSVAQIERVDPSTIKINYFKTSNSDTIMLNNKITQEAQAILSGSGPFCIYSVATNNCATFTLAGLLQANAITASQANSLNKAQSTVPNYLYNGLQNFSLFSVDEFDLMNLENAPEGCVSTDDGLGNTSSACYP